MGRRRRPHLPGAIFHIAARTIRRERWLVPRLRDRALAVVADAIPRSEARLLAVAIMPNHLHLVVQQGDRPLARLMQPVLRRLALEVQAAHGLEGPVFWRPYAAQPCLDPGYARNAIVYTHLNPVRAGLSDDPREYPWTSHGLYAGRVAGRGARRAISPIRGVLDASVALPLFATLPRRTPDQLRSDYRQFVARRIELDAAAEADTMGIPPTRSGPHARPLDMVWGERLSPLFHGRVRPGPREPDGLPIPPAPDMTTIARRMIDAEAPLLSLDAIRGRGGGHSRARLRRSIIRRLHSAGYRNVQIARFLDLSESAVSDAVLAPPPAG